MAQRKHRRRGPDGAGRRRESRPARQATDCRFWIYGRHAVAAALANRRRRCHRLLATAADAVTVPEWRSDLHPEIVDRAALAQRLPPDAVHQGVAVQVEPLAEPSFGEWLETAPSGAPVLVLDQVTDPRNVGAILRSAAAFEAAGLVLARRHAPPESGVMAKAASGALDLVPVLRVPNLVRALRDLADAGYWRLGLAPEAEPTLEQALPTGPVALVLGAEGEGLRRLTVEACDALARLPIGPAMPSLNVSAAATLALHIARQANPLTPK